MEAKVAGVNVSGVLASSDVYLPVMFLSSVLVEFVALF
jgi:hypothetical protein